MRNLLLLLVIAAFPGCLGSTATALAPVSSPNGSLTLTPKVNRSKVDATSYLCVAFEIADANGERVHYIQSNASDSMKWAVGWFDDAATVVLYSADTGTHAWRLDDDDDRTVVPITPRLPPELIAFSDRLRAAKYDR